MYSVILISDVDYENHTYSCRFCNDGNLCDKDKFEILGAGDYVYSQILETTYCPNGFLYGAGDNFETNKDTITYTHNPYDFCGVYYDGKISPKNSGYYKTPFLKFPFAQNFYEYQTVTNYPMSLEQIECLLKSLPDWYGNYESHYISLNIRNSIQENEESYQRLHQLIQMANDKGWTVYENYNY